MLVARAATKQNVAEGPKARNRAGADQQLLKEENQEKEDRIGQRIGGALATIEKVPVGLAPLSSDCV